MPEPLICFVGITKRFPGVVALRDVHLDIAQGSCHGLVGENGAGKSTLGKILAGIHRPDGGQIRLSGSEVCFGGPHEALGAGVGIVHQELSFCENLTVAENLSLGSLPTCGPFWSRDATERLARECLDSLRVELDPQRRLGDLPVSQQQLVQIASVVSRGARVIVMDEPTSSLSQAEACRLFALIERLRDAGTTLIYVSHRLEEVFMLCDTITVLRDGAIVATKAATEWSRDGLVQAMIGRPLDDYFPRHMEQPLGEELLRVEDLRSPGRLEGISFSLRAGEVLGLAGLVGSGRTEIAEAICGLDRRATGRILVRGRPMRIRHPRQALSLGIGLVPEDRKRHGLVLSMRASENLTLPTLKRHARMGWVKRRSESAVVREFFAALDIRAATPGVVTESLSGGNQQKIVLAKWVAARCPILIVDEPTRGIDVGAKAEIHALIDGLARQGVGVLLISSELPELINLATRILVLRGGEIVGELSRGDADQDALLRLMAGIEAT
ncbi:sugar ABC transporter ATP-binding protein [Candidatus Fermentibacteria bacterium]|nr:sugar ABC transporter ATP-binding protein [Candidatus Fermentibacteria bacterium]